MRDVGLVFDTAALLAYANGSIAVGERLSAVGDDGDTVLIPTTCLASAYRDTSARGAEYLDLIANLSHTIVAPLERDHCAVLGGWARTLGLDTAHAAMEAAAHAVVALMTDRRDAVSRVLPKDWPIIDI